MTPQYFENGDGARPGRHKQMGHLLDLLRDNGIRDQQSLRDWIAGRSIIKHGEAEFQVFTAKDLGLDDENRWHLPDFKIREVIVDCDKVCWRRFKIEPPCRLNFEPGLMANL